LRHSAFSIHNSELISIFALTKSIATSEMDVPKDDVNSQFTFTYDDIKGTVHVVDHQTGEEYDLLKEDTGWFDAEFKFDV
jgi:hypothetical protein